jgi:putative transposase
MDTGMGSYAMYSDWRMPACLHNGLPACCNVAMTILTPLLVLFLLAVLSGTAPLVFVLPDLFAWRFVVLRWLTCKSAVTGYRLRFAPPHAGRQAAKPAWVRHEVLRLAALSGAGCRSIANIFNRLHAVRRCMTVSKSYVGYTLRKHRYEIEVLRRQIKHRPPRPVAKNHTWAIDMTGKGDTVGAVHTMLGIEDHGSRALLSLQLLTQRNAWTLLGHVFLAIGQCGKPRVLRSDNDAVFKSRVFRLVMRLAGIRQQFTVPGCPWMNGHIERLFGTFKHKLDQLEVDGAAALTGLLTEFRFWYNAVRPHQNLAGRTPAEAWNGIDPYANPPKSVHWFEGWDGLLTGYCLRY